MKIDWTKTNVAPKGVPAAEDLYPAIVVWLKKHCQGMTDHTLPWDLAEIAKSVVLEAADREGILKRAHGLFPKPRKVPPKPKVGDTIYVTTSLYIDHGEDDVIGGKALVTKVTKHWVYVREHPGHGYNWGVLGPDQAELKKQYKNRRARPDPDPPHRPRCKEGCALCDELRRQRIK